MVLGSGIIGLLAATPATAHHPGATGNSGGAGAIHVITAIPLAKGETVAGVVVEYISLDELSDAILLRAGEEAVAEGEEPHVHSLRSIISPSLNLAYGVTEDLTIAFRLPYVVRTDIRAAEYNGTDVEAELHGDSDGIGDLTTLAQWRFLNDSTTRSEAALLLGVTAPTGKTNEKDNEGEPFDAEFQPGAGAWNGLFGLALTQRYGLWTFDASGIYTLVGNGTQGTNLGDRFHYGIAASYRVIGATVPGPVDAAAHDHSSHSHSGHTHVHIEATPSRALDLILEFNGEWQERQVEHGEVDENSGGHLLFVSPGARYSVGPWSGFASVGIPIVNDFNGIQSEPNWRLVAGVTYDF
jgi:hypothetical protein